METLFGTDGMRGVAGQFPLDAPTVKIVGSALARHLRTSLGRTPLIVVGRDTRQSGSWLEHALLEGVMAENAEWRSAGVITTPGVAFLTRTLPADAGVVISASHNPYQDNGIKIFAPSGHKLDDATERLIEADVFANYHPPQLLTDSGWTTDDGHKLRERYFDFLAEDIGGQLSLRSLKLVVDCANGAASSLAPALLKRLGATVVAINSEPDGLNINKDCGSLHIQGLRQRVISEDANLGVAYDGDADRALFIDSAGNYVDGDATLWVLGQYLQAHGELNQNLVVATVMSNLGLEIAFRSRGIKLVRTAVGDKHVLDELLRLNARLGGEQSGHIIIPKLSLAGDGMITTLCLLRAVQEAEKSLTELAAGFERYPQILLNVVVREKRPFNEIDEVQKIAADLEATLAGRGRLLLRYSGTEPLARIMIEGEKQNEIEAYAQRLAQAIQQTLGTP